MSEELAEAILRILEAHSQPLTTHAILHQLQTDSTLGSITKTELNSVINQELKAAGKVERVPPISWKIARPEVPNGIEVSDPVETNSGTKHQPDDQSPCLTSSDLSSIATAVREDITAGSSKVDRQISTPFSY